MTKIAKESGLKADEPMLVGAGKLFTYLWDVAWRNAPGTLEGDVEALHDMRVAMRRLRTALQNFEGPKHAAPDATLVPRHLRREMEEQRRQLGKLGDALGAVRDFDVLREDVDGYIQQHAGTDAEEHPGLQALCRYLQAEREAVFPKMVKRLKKAAEPGGLREQFARFALGITAVETQPLLLRGAAQLIVPQRVAEVLDNAHTLDDDEDAVGHHEFRKSLRRLRYALETLAPCLPESPTAHIKLLTQLQDYLGEMQDLDVLRTTVAAAFKGDKAPPAEDVTAFFAYGERRTHELLGQTRALWTEQQQRNWPQSLAHGAPHLPVPQIPVPEIPVPDAEAS